MLKTSELPYVPTDIQSLKIDIEYRVGEDYTGAIVHLFDNTEYGKIALIEAKGFIDPTDYAVETFYAVNNALHAVGRELENYSTVLVDLINVFGLDNYCMYNWKIEYENRKFKRDKRIKLKMDKENPYIKFLVRYYEDKFAALSSPALDYHSKAKLIAYAFSDDVINEFTGKSISDALRSEISKRYEYKENELSCAK